MDWADVLGQARAVRILRAGLQTGRPAEAYLFSGKEGIGKRLTATLFAKAVLCATQGPCGRCAACRKVEAGAHPDRIDLSPDGQTIKIEQVEALQGRLVFRPIEGPRRVILIEPADRLTPEAADRLLKTLEEPPTACTFILITARPEALPSTVRSRCRVVTFSPLPRRLVEQVLVGRHGLPAARASFVAALSGGSLGRAVGMDPAAEEEIQRRLRRTVLGTKRSADPALLELAEEHGRDRVMTEKVLHLIVLWLEEGLLSGRRLTPEAVFRLWDLVYEIEEGLHRNVNRPLALEVLFLEMHAAMAERP